MTAVVASPSWRSHWSAPAFAGKKIVLAGRVSRYEKQALIELVNREGGEVVDQVAPGVHFVVVFPGGAKDPPAVKKAETLNKKHNAGIDVVEAEDFRQRLDATPAEALEMLRAGAAARQRWIELATRSDLALDLSGVDLRGAKLVEFPLGEVDFTEADLRKADLTKALLGDLVGTRLDGATLVEATIESLSGCSLVGADATQLSVTEWDPQHRTACNADFTRAKLVRACFADAQGPQAKFVKADLSRSQFENCKFVGVDFSNSKLVDAVFRECDLSDANFAKADLTGLDAARCRLVGADFRGAKLRGANFYGADLSNARFDGADVEGATFIAAKLDEKRLALAKGKPRSAGTPNFGPRFQELEALVKKIGHFWGSAHVAVGERRYSLSIAASNRKSPKAVTINIGRAVEDDEWLPDVETSGANLRKAFEAALAYLGPGGTLHPDDVNISNRHQHDVGVAGICDAFGVVAPTAAERKAAEKADKLARVELKKTLQAELKNGAAGVKAFNARTADDFRVLDNLDKLDLAGAKLDGLTLDSQTLCGSRRRTWEWFELAQSNLDGASLKNVRFHHVDFDKSSFQNATIRDAKINARLAECSFDGATLEGVDFTDAEMESADFGAATITRCDFTNVDLTGADLSRATIRDCVWKDAMYDDATDLPEDFDHTREMDWCGDGPPPHETAAERQAAREALANLSRTAPGSPEEIAARRAQRSAEYMQRLRKVVDKAKIDKALKMLKAERFELFVETTDEHLVGVVKSQSDPDLVYACRLASDGSYSCCTHKLNVCGGLGGALCKHLLVLAVGLERSDRMPPETLGLWVASSRGRKPTLDKDAMGEVLLRYKGAQAGEIDWRPTETTPEDFYAF